MRSIFSRSVTVLLVLSTLSLQGCITAARKSADMRGYLEQGQPDQALQQVERGGESDDVMVNMNRGILRRMVGDFSGSNQALELAKKRIEDLYATSITEQAGAVIVNDELISFEGDRYEQVLVHAYKALNYIAMGDIYAARVEILQSDVKMMEWGDAPEEDPFMRYLSGIVFEALGEKDDALVAYRKAASVYKKSRERHGLEIPEQLKQDLLRGLAEAKLWNEYKQYQREFGMANWKPERNRETGELVVLLHNGLAPQRDQKAFQTFSTELSLNIRIAVPAYPLPPQPISPARVNVAGQQVYLETVENIDGLARAALSDKMPVITTRAIARAVVKKKAEKEVGEKKGGFAQFAMFVVNQTTEIADTRCWNTLPQEIQMARIMLPEGQHEITLEIMGNRGNVVDRVMIPVVIKKGNKTIISEHWTAPSSIMKPMAVVATVR